MFESAYVGAGGSLSGNAAALRILVRHPKAQEIFDALWNSTNDVARLYALAAFWYLRPDDFAAAAAQLRNDETEVDTLNGCIETTQKVSEIVIGDCAASGARLPIGTGAPEMFCLGLPICDGVIGGEPSIEPIEDASLRCLDCKRNPSDWPRLVLPAAWPTKARNPMPVAEQERRAAGVGRRCLEEALEQERAYRSARP